MTAHTPQPKNSQIPLYEMVFHGTSAKVIAWALFVFMVLQPATLALASEPTTLSSAEETEVGNDTELEVVETEVVLDIDDEEIVDDEVVLNTEVVNDEEIAELATLSSEEDADADEETQAGSENEIEMNAEEEDLLALVEELTQPAVEEGETSTSTEQEVASSTEDTSTNGTSGSDLSSDDSDGSDTEDGVKGTDNESEAAGHSNASTDPEEEQEVVETEIASSTATSTEEQTEELHVVSNAAYEFSEDECVAVADGSFYCAVPDDALEAVSEDALFAQRDEDGDYEIYLTREGETTKATNNVVDDMAPYYDAESETVVWHRLINDRYQIISLDIESGEETVLTSTRTNNMQPVRMGDSTVWQRWVTNNWEIILLEDGQETQLTDNDVHDIAPVLRDGHVMWQTTGVEGEKQVSIYVLATSEIRTIDDVDGGAIDNPRFVLVYDTTFDNGDTVTRGYDFASGKVIPLQAQPADLPEEIPEADTTGETRALLQQKPQTRDSVSENEDDTSGANATSTATTTLSAEDKADLIIADLVAAKQASSSAATTQSTSSTSSVDHISDVVIPPFASSTGEEVS